ncbi:MAG: NAD-dependent epimerase/dehydratase family protein [Flavobacteriaceae bacterium]|jgi:nucleoside-diphosphate-sugar epimerase|nr:NAD-dependent epimerase/dehydratase family protein [Flavobacteriaceae bacterium]MBT6447120.1 NAD-dependent epimerase/dehydratase family protein [Flavobacteriaceae bacterium]
MKILILGSRGFIGRNLKNILSNNAELFCPSSKELDLRDRNKVNNFFKNHFFDFVINCSIYGGRRTKKDNPYTLYFNLQMFFNILNNKQYFNKLINFGSGAEFDRSFSIDPMRNNVLKSLPEDFYGMSKNIIARIAYNDSNIYNFRLFGVFGIDEEDDRFIKSCIYNSLNNIDILINDNRLFDFFYIYDLTKIIESLIFEKSIHFPNELDLVYGNKILLSQIADFIVLSTKSKVKISTSLNEGKPYCGTYNSFLNNFNLTGLQGGIIEIIQNYK